MSERLNIEVETIRSWNDMKTDEDLTIFINTLGSMYRQ